MLDRIVKTAEKYNEDTWKISIDLYVRELAQGKGRPDLDHTGSHGDQVDTNSSVDCSTVNTGTIHIPVLGGHEVLEEEVDYGVGRNETEAQINGTAVKVKGAGKSKDGNEDDGKIDVTFLLLLPH